MNLHKNTAYRLLPHLVQGIPLDRLMRITGKRSIFPFYHLVSDEEVPHLKYLYPVRDTGTFIRDLDFLLQHYKPIGISDLLVPFHKGRSLQGNTFLLSFDDGLREFHDVVAPILLNKGIPAICFLNSAFVDNRELFFRYKASLLIGRLLETGDAGLQRKIQPWFHDHHLPFSNDYKGLLQISYDRRSLLDDLANLLGYDFSEYLKKNHPYMDSSEIHSLSQQGFTFGAHSIDHPEYRFIPEQEQFRQTAGCLRELKEKFGLKLNLFSFPFTDFGVKKHFFDTVFDPGNPVADLTFGGAGLKRDPVQRNIQRIPFEGTTLTAKQILSTEYTYYIIKAIFGKNLIRR